MNTRLSREETNQIKEGEEDKTKCYEALCYTDTPIDQEELDHGLASMSDSFIIEQKTPIRVLHRYASRRALLLLPLDASIRLLDEQ